MNAKVNGGLWMLCFIKCVVSPGATHAGGGDVRAVEAAWARSGAYGKHRTM